MKRAVDEITAMTEDLEASGYSRQQSEAAIRAIANSIEKFAVTPELLREALREQSDEINQRFDEFRAEMRTELRTLSSHLFTLTLSLAIGLIALLGTFIASQWL